MRALGIALAVALISANAVAQTPILRADLGYSRVTNGDGRGGFGLDVYGAYDLGLLPGLLPEVQLGFHRFSNETFGIKSSISVLPIFAGARYGFSLAAPVKPFVGAHLGLAHSRTSSEGSMYGYSVDGSTSSTDFGLNLGGGADYPLNDKLGVGAALWYYRVLGDGDDLNMLTFGVNAAYAL